jgi:chaperonin GroEL (HSP60 family)
MVIDSLIQMFSLSKLHWFKDKILQSGDPTSKNMQVTNDGATILKAIGVDNPAAKVLVGTYEWLNEE